MEIKKAITLLNFANFDALEEYMTEWPNEFSIHKLLFQARIKELEGNFDDALTYTEDAFFQIKGNKTNGIMLFILANKLMAQLKLGRLENLSELFVEIDDTVSKLQQNRTLLENWSMGNIYNLRGVYWMLDGQFELAVKSFQQSIEVRKKIGFDTEIGFAIQNIGLVYLKKGELSEAMDKFELGLEIFEKLNFDIGISTVRANIAEIYVQKGDIDKAIPYLTSAIKLHKKMNLKGRPQLFVHTYMSLARIYQIKGQYENARALYENILDKLLENKNSILLAEIFFDLIILEIENKEVDQANLWKKQFDKLILKETNEFIQVRHNFLNGLLLKQKVASMKELVIVMEIFNDIIENESTENDVFILSLINYIEMQFKEIQMFDDLSILDKIELNLHKILLVLESQGSLLLNIEVLILKSRIDLIKLDPKEMFRSLEQAIKIARDYHLTYQIKRIDKEINNYLEEFKKMKELTDEREGLSVQIEQADILEYLYKVSKLVKSEIVDL